MGPKNFWTTVLFFHILTNCFIIDIGCKFIDTLLNRGTLKSVSLNFTVLDA